MPDIERRFLPAATCPVGLKKRDGSQDLLYGYGAVFFDPGDPGTQYQLYSDLAERIMPTAFDRALREGQDVAGLFNHNPDAVLGRTSSGTMKCSVDKRGLAYEIVPGDTSIARDVCQHVSRGDVKGSSFSFRVVKQMFVAGAEGEPDIREIHDVDLYDTGPVTFPAYEGTTAGMRCLGQPEEGIRAAYEAWKKSRSAPPPPAASSGPSRAAVHARARIVEIEMAG